MVTLRRLWPSISRLCVIFASSRLTFLRTAWADGTVTAEESIEDELCSFALTGFAGWHSAAKCPCLTNKTLRQSATRVRRQNIITLLSAGLLKFRMPSHLVLTGGPDWPDSETNSCVWCSEYSILFLILCSSDPPWILSDNASSFWAWMRPSSYFSQPITPEIHKPFRHSMLRRVEMVEYQSIDICTAWGSCKIDGEWKGLGANVILNTMNFLNLPAPK